MPADLADQDHIPAPLSAPESARLAELEQVIGDGLGGFVRVGQALAAIRDSHLYRATHGTFADYCRERWGLSPSYAYDMIGGAAVTESLSAIADTPAPANEGQAREARRAPDPAAAMRSAQDAAEERGGQLTAADIKAAADAQREAEQDRPRDDAPAGSAKPAPKPSAGKRRKPMTTIYGELGSAAHELVRQIRAAMADDRHDPALISRLDAEALTDLAADLRALLGQD